MIVDTVLLFVVAARADWALAALRPTAATTTSLPGPRYGVGNVCESKGLSMPVMRSASSLGQQRNVDTCTGQTVTIVSTDATAKAPRQMIALFAPATRRL